MDYRDWDAKNLKRIEIRHGENIASVWHTRSDKPLIVMVHGISGDHSGMVPLATELVQQYQIAIVELPGHGDSDMLPLPNAAALRQWFEAILVGVEEELGRPAFICAHSFGCSAVLGKKILTQYQVLLLNPVPTPSDMYGRYARVIMRSVAFWALIYNWRVLVYLRGMALAKVHTPDALRRIRWVGRQSRPNYQQTVFQAGLVDLILDSSAYQQVADGTVALVLCGLGDTTARQRDSLDMEAVFGSSPVVFLTGGHLLPIESPQRVADVILKTMVH